jgi:osmoprotectant transport system permease protein
VAQQHYAIAVLPQTAETYGLSKCSDLVAVAPQLTFGAESNFFAQEFTDRYWSFVEYYGIQFANYSSSTSTSNTRRCQR